MGGQNKQGFAGSWVRSCIGETNQTDQSGDPSYDSDTGETNRKSDCYCFGANFDSVIVKMSSWIELLNWSTLLSCDQDETKVSLFKGFSLQRPKGEQPELSLTRYIQHYDWKH